jgi:hypothetical protein
MDPLPEATGKGVFKKTAYEPLIKKKTFFMTNNLKNMYEDLIQSGLLKIKDGKLVLKRKNPKIKRKVKIDARYASFRKQMSEFAKASTASKLLRTALYRIKFIDRSIHPHLTSLMNKIIKTDTANEKGNRSIMNGDEKLLTEIKLNVSSNLWSVFRAPFVAGIDPKTGSSTLEIPRLKTAEAFNWPDNVDAVQIDSLVASINFDTGEQEERLLSSVKILRTQKQFPPFRLVTDKCTTRDRLLLHIVSVRFYIRQKDGRSEALQNRQYWPVEIINVARGE